MKSILRIFSVFQKPLFSGRELRQDRSGKEHKEYGEAGTKKIKKELSEQAPCPSSLKTTKHFSFIAVVHGHFPKL